MKDYGDFKEGCTGAYENLQDLRQEYDDLKNDWNYIKSLLDNEFEKNIELKRENEQLKQRCKELRNDLIDHSALIKMLEDAKALDIEDMIWNTMDYRTQTEFDDDFADYREDAKKRWRE